jgi:hypothetical protein
MKTPLTAIGIALVAVGGIWFLQGIGVLPGSFMTGQTKWAVIGTVAAVVGVAMLALARRS